MDRVRIALAQVNLTVGDLDGNRRIAEQAISEARRRSADLVALPELALTGYPPEDLLLKPSFVRENVRSLEALARSVSGIAAVVGFADPDGGRLYNAAALLAEGEIKGIYRKHHLPNYGVFDERRYFEPGEGILLGRLRGLVFGITICEDVWVELGPHTACAAAGAALVININGSPYHRRKGAERRELLVARARELSVAFAYVNMVGGQDELVFDGQSYAVSAEGEVIARGAQFAEELLLFELQAYARPTSPGRPGAGVRLVELPAPAPRERPPLAPRIAPELVPAAEVYRALVVGVRDYLQKNGFSEAVVGLSGGVDSSLTATVAADALGPSRVLGVLLPSQFTSPESVEYAARLAANLDILTEELPIHDAYEAMLKTLDPVFSETPFGIAEENLQSRVRGTALMAITNKTGRILLSTGNKSEMATGYATLYGDMAGGFAVLKDVPKTLVYELARWRNRDQEVIPDEVIRRPPTAELRAGQLDADTLPPYELLDPILEAYVEGHQSVGEMVAAFDAEVVRRVVELVDRAEYKRRQAPPGIKITPRAFGRDRRLPITNRYRGEGAAR